MSDDLESRVAALEAWKESLERKEFGVNPSRGRAESEQVVIDYCKSLGLPEADGTFFWCRWESAGAGGWYNAGKKIRDWKMVVRQWRAAGWCPSQKRGQAGKLPIEIAVKRQAWQIRNDIESSKLDRQAVKNRLEAASRAHGHITTEAISANWRKCGTAGDVGEYDRLTTKLKELEKELGE
jgi:hypothetical protein